MPWIYLDATSTNNTYKRDATVLEGEHSSCKLFRKYMHSPNNRISAEDILVYKKAPSTLTLGIGSHATINRGTGVYKTSTVSGAHVYYNIFDTAHKYPLLLHIWFSGQNVTSKYYKRSHFNTEIDSSKRKNLDDLTDYKSGENDKELLQSLIDENDNIPDPLTYDLVKKTKNPDGERYNGDKIKLVDDTKSVSNLSSQGFTKYKHTPEKNHSSKKSCVICNNNVLLYWKETQGDTINEIQGKVLKNVIVFFSNKIENQPLLAGFEIQTKWEYYYYKKYIKGFFWQRIDRGASYHLFGKFTEEHRIQNELILNQANLVKILKKVEFTVLNSVVLLLEKTKLYPISDVKSAIKGVSPEMIPDPSTSDVQPEEINVDKQNCRNLQEKNYQCYLHKVIPVGELDSAELRILIPTSYGNKKYSEIKLYKSETTSEENRDYLFYKKNQSDSCKLWAYFYGSDPRPLLLCHGGRIYKLKNKDSYFTQWIATSGTEKCECENVSFYTKLLEELTKAVGILNQVLLFEHPPSCNSGNAKKYNVHQYNGKQINIQVNCQNVNSELSVGYQSCFRKVTHTPSGMNGTFIGSGFRLGNILYNTNPKQKGSVTYGKDSTYKHHPLMEVGVYFYNRDTGYKDPLLVELQFKGDGGECLKEYYKLYSINETSMSWTIDTQATGKVSSGAKDLVDYLEQLRYGFKNLVHIQIQKNTKGSYDLKVGKGSQSVIQFTPPKTGINKQIEVDEDKSCKLLNQSEYTCYKHKLSDSSLDDVHQDIGGLKITTPKQLPKENIAISSSDQEITFHNIRPGNESGVKTKINESKDTDEVYSKISSMLTEYTPIYYSICMGDLYVYFKIGDPRPLLVCFDSMGYRPLKLPKLDKENYSYTSNDYNKWVRAYEIKKCGCTEDKLISLLKEVESIYDGDNTVAIATSTTVTLGLAGGGTGLVIYKYSDFFLSLFTKLLTKGAA